METVQVDMRGSVAWLFLNRPEALNALSREMREELIRATAMLADDSNVRVVIISGNGRAFSAGGDVNAMGGRGPVAETEHVKRANRIIWQIATMPKPVIAAVNGPAYGAGFSLALACDLIFASDRATFSAPFSKLGVMPTLGATYFLPRHIGLLNAKLLSFTGKAIDAHEALRMGLATEVVPHENLHTVAQAMADQLICLSPAALEAIKMALNKSSTSELDSMLALESFAQGVLWDTEEHKTAVKEFVARRKK
jgi:2-(1,2-epoxy-1,2-dihydrophenyl)acetyl-CoA isomerase